VFRHSIRLALVAVALTTGLTGLPADDKKESPPTTANVFTHPTKLTTKDTLTDGEKGTAIEITGDTVLIWVDLMPDARYSHPTEYVLISAAGTKVVKGEWWPVLNGMPLFRGKGEKVEPVKLGGASGERK
jgi:hypothetical protein